MNESKEDDTEPYQTWDTIKMNIHDTSFLIDKYFVKGFLTMVVGDVASGKSTFVLRLIGCVTDGLVTPGGKYLSDEDQGTALWLEFEDGEGLNIPRAEAMGIDLTKVTGRKIDKLMDPKLGFSIDGFASINNYLDSHPKCKVIVVDSLSRALSGAEENSNTAVQPLMGSLSTLAKDRGLVVVVVHHVSKGKRKSEHESGESVLDIGHIRGASALIQLPRVIIGVNPLYVNADHSKEKYGDEDEDGDNMDDDNTDSDNDDSEIPQPRIISWLKASMFTRGLPKSAGFTMDDTSGSGFKFTRRVPKRAYSEVDVDGDTSCKTPEFITMLLAAEFVDRDDVSVQEICDMLNEGGLRPDNAKDLKPGYRYFKRVMAALKNTGIAHYLTHTHLWSFKKIVTLPTHSQSGSHSDSD